MKILGKTEDKAIDNLFRAQAARAKSASLQCEAFDADLANAYVERALNQFEQQRYETHIAGCVHCRKLTVLIMRAAQADELSPRYGAAAPVDMSPPGWAAALKGFGLMLVTPRFALAVTAIIILAIAVPVLISSQRQNKDAAVQQSTSAAPPSSPSATLSDKQQTQPASEELARNSSGLIPAPEVAEGRTYGYAQPQDQAKERDQAGEKAEDQLIALSKDAPVGQAAPAPPPQINDDSAKKETTSSTTAKTDESANTTEGAQPKASEPAPPDAEKPLPRISPEEARRLPETDKDSQPRVVPLAPGRSGSETVGDKDKRVIRPESDRPRSESRSDKSSSTGRIADGPASASLREAESSVKPPTRSTREMKVQGKKFFLLDGIWTDKDYRKDKELPVIPVTQDSELYNELIAKHSKLKLYFAGLKDQSAIIVYKNTVYKLTPQK